MRNSSGKPVAVVIGATSKWQSDGRNTRLAHGSDVDDSGIPLSARWGVGGAIAQKFAAEGFFVVLTTRSAANAEALEAGIRSSGGECMTVELDLSEESSIEQAFASVDAEAGPPDPSVTLRQRYWRRSIVSLRRVLLCLKGIRRRRLRTWRTPWLIRLCTVS